MQFSMKTVSRQARKQALLASICVSACLGGASSARAALILTISEPGYAPQTATDAATPGQVEIFGSYGTFQTDIEIGLSNINSPTSPSAYLQVQALDVTNMPQPGGPAADTLTVTLSETTPFTFPGNSTSNLLMTSALGGTVTPATAGDLFTFQSYATPSVGAVATSGLQSYTATTYAGTEPVDMPGAAASFVRSPSFTLSDTTFLSVAPGEVVNLSGTTTVTTPVPEPMSMGLLAGAALAGLSRRNRRRLV